MQLSILCGSCNSPDSLVEVDATSDGFLVDIDQVPAKCPECGEDYPLIGEDDEFRVRLINGTLFPKLEPPKVREGYKVRDA